MQRAMVNSSTNCSPHIAMHPPSIHTHIYSKCLKCMKLQCMGESAVVPNVVVCIATVILANYTVTVSTSFRMLPGVCLLRVQ